MRHLSPLLALAMAVSVALPAASAPPLSALDLAMRIVVPFYSATDDDSRYCTGFMARPAAVNPVTGHTPLAWFLTAGHCLLSTRPIRRLPVGWEVTSPSHALNIPTADFGAFVSYDWRPDPHVYPPFLDRPLQEGEPLVSVGYGQGVLTLLRGHFTGTERRTGQLMIAFSPPVRGGMSGSPVLTADGHLAGILVAASLLDDGHTGFATPIATVLRLLSPLAPTFVSPETISPFREREDCDPCPRRR